MGIRSLFSRLGSKSLAQTSRPKRVILGGRKIRAGNPWEELFLVFAEKAESEVAVEVFDSEGKWICEVPTVPEADLGVLDEVDQDGVTELPFSIRRTTRFQRQWLREEDQYFTEGGVEEVTLEELHEAAYENESFILSSGLEGAPADYSSRIGPPRHCILPKASWSTSQEVTLDLRGANFRGADLSSAKLERCDVRGADFSNANLSGASLRGLCLKACSFQGANLSDADLRGTSGLVLDNTTIVGAKFGIEVWNLVNKVRNKWFEFRRRLKRLSPMEKMQFPPGSSRVATEDPWTFLVRRYTGPKMALYGALFIAFLLPLAIRAFFWNQINEIQELLQDASALDVRDRISPCIAPSCERHRIVSILLRFDEGGAAGALATLFLVYNLLRGFLTFRISMLHQDVNRDGISPARSSCSFLLFGHGVIQVLFVIVFAHLIWVGWEVLFQTDVLLPAVGSGP
jgi:hypothetical protein